MKNLQKIKNVKKRVFLNNKKRKKRFLHLWYSLRRKSCAWTITRPLALNGRPTIVCCAITCKQNFWLEDTVVCSHGRWFMSDWLLECLPLPDTFRLVTNVGLLDGSFFFEDHTLHSRTVTLCMESLDNH